MSCTYCAVPQDDAEPLMRREHNLTSSEYTQTRVTPPPNQRPILTHTRPSICHWFIPSICHWFISTLLHHETPPGLLKVSDKEKWRKKLKSAGGVFWDSFPIDFRVAPCEKPPGEIDPNVTIGVNMGNGRYRVRGQSKVNPMWYEVDTAACKQFLFNNG